MTIETTYTQARQNLASLLDRVTNDREIVYVKRRGGESVAFIAADELQSLLETMHLLRSPKNAERLLSAIERARSGMEPPQDPEELRKELGLDKG
jgi:antitoxin YefM